MFFENNIINAFIVIFKFPIKQTGKRIIELKHSRNELKVISKFWFVKFHTSLRIKYDEVKWKLIKSHIMYFIHLKNLIFNCTSCYMCFLFYLKDDRMKVLDVLYTQQLLSNFTYTYFRYIYTFYDPSSLKNFV